MKRKEKVVTLAIFILIVLSSGLLLISKINTRNIINNKEVTKEDKVAKIIASFKDEDIVYQGKIGKITSLVTKKDERYTSFMYSELGEELEIKDLVKSGKLNDFEEKIQELLNKKYPSFIVEALDESEKNYSFYENRLVINYYNYEITPEVDEDIFLTVNYNEIKDFLTFTVKLDKTYENEDGFKIDEAKKHIAITFDDGPSSYTSELIDVLNANKVHATFFFVGNKLNNNKDTIEKVNNADCEIGYHSYNHTSFKREKASLVLEEYEKSNMTLKSIINKEFALTRPPYGSLSSEVKKSLNTPFILWNIDTNDWRYKDVDYLVNHVLDNATDGDIILFHDSYRTSIDAIKKLLPILYTRGYQVVTVSTLASLKNTTLKPNTAYYSLK